jgi:uroporphyrinogen-III decarboxylase
MEFGLNYLPDIFNIYDHNILHMCGKVTSHLEYFGPQLKDMKNLNMINIGPFVSIERTQEILEHKIGVAGNIDHVKLLPKGNPQGIKNAVHKAINESHGDSRFMVAPGCEITADTPKDNVLAFVNTVKTYTK